MQHAILLILLACAPTLAQEPPSRVLMPVPAECAQGGCVLLTAAQAKEVRETLMGLLAEVERLQKSC